MPSTGSGSVHQLLTTGPRPDIVYVLGTIQGFETVAVISSLG